MQKSKLRIGLLLNGTELLAWQYRMIETIKDSDYAEISLVVQKTLTDEKQLLPLATRVANNIRAGTFLSAVIRVTLNILERVLIGKPGVLPDAFKAVDGTKLLAGVQVVEVNPRRRKYSDYIDGNELARIQAHNIDVFIRLGFRILRGEILRSARYGVWSYHHGDNRVNRGGPAGYWEVMESALECGAVLQILTEDLDGGTVLNRSYSNVQ